VTNVNITGSSEAHEKGFAVFNGVQPHICVDLPDHNITATFKTPDGRLLTIAFMHYGENKMCADISFHSSGKKIKSGGSSVPAFNVSVRGMGPLLYNGVINQEYPPTLVVVDMNPQ